jgi:hypothetical protein
MKNKILFAALAMLIATPSFADKIRDSGFLGCKGKKDMISLALLAKSGASVADFTAEAKKFEAAKKCRMFKKGEKVEMYTFGDKETGADIHQIAFPAGSNNFYWIDKRAISFDQ